MMRVLLCVEKRNYIGDLAVLPGESCTLELFSISFQLLPRRLTPAVVVMMLSKPWPVDVLLGPLTV